MALVDATRGSDGAPVATPIDRFLAAQADLRVVERFARAEVTARTGRWSDLIPLSAPGPGEQYRFEVDLDSCTGCKACVTACHSLNGLDETESFRSIGMLLSPTPAPASAAAPAAVAAPAEQTVTTACHHCLDPGCLNGCPAEAYEKDPVTGIVKHLDDACIGCQYCTLTCPYDVPVYNDRLGIVRKCDLCADRLADGEAPACVQGCPTSAITVSTVSTVTPAGSTTQGTEGLDGTDADGPTERTIVPGAAPSQLTGPTTWYRGRLLEPSSPTPAVDPTPPVPQHDHLPLVVMLVLSQWSVGVLAGSLLLGAVTDGRPLLSTTTATALAAASALASFAHLGQPLKAWRAVLGWSHSWLSREVLALSAYIGLAALAAGLHAIGSTGPAAPLSVGAALVGAATVGCSVMIYVATGRRWWRPSTTAPRFAGTVLVAAASWAAVATSATERGRPVGVVAAVVVAAVVGAERHRDRGLRSATDPDLRRTATLLDGPLAAVVRRRLVLTALGAAALVLGTAAGDEGLLPVGVGVVAVGLLVAGELTARRLFFRACAPRTMPGSHR
ncbi:MAG: DmsC/YnfH family molybdoenzyme membrane anchor subunit [Actinomycetota bacterium]